MPAPQDGASSQKVLLPSCRSVVQPSQRSGAELLMTERRINRRLATILAADVVGYSRLMGADEAGTLAALKQHRNPRPAGKADNGFGDCLARRTKPSRSDRRMTICAGSPRNLSARFRIVVTAIRINCGRADKSAASTKCLSDLATAR
jgi:hypothetical protein